MTIRVVLGTILAGSVGSGCQAVGHYLGNRARDFGQCWRLQVGLGQGVGAGARFAGLLDGGLGVAAWNRRLTLGFDYGDSFPEDHGGDSLWDIEAQFPYLRITAHRATPAPPSAAPRTAEEALVRLLFWRQTLSVPPFAEFAFGVLPALFSTRGGVSPGFRDSARRGLATVDRRELSEAWRERWIWSPPPTSVRESDDPPRVWTHARLHAFDCEAWAFCVCVGARAGFSPGEFLDFVLGWFGVDIAGDDRPFAPRAADR